VREGARLFADDTSPAPIGVVTSGSFGPSVNAPVAMGYVPATHPADGTRLFAEVRGQRLAMRVKDLPFVPHHYKR
jgi:aminomethyltransferase